MKIEILYCSKCDRFTLCKECCGSKIFSTKPAKFSLEDKWGKYRRLGRKC